MSTIDRADLVTVSDPNLTIVRIRERDMLVTRLLTLAIAALVLVLSIARLDSFPAAWFDEGSYLEVSRNIAESRLYAVQSADGTLDYAPVLSVGPTVLLPVAGAIWLGGNRLDVARAIAVIFLILATLIYFRSLRSIAGSFAAIIGIAVLVTMPALRWLMHGRQVAGEVPGVLFLLAGAALAFRARSLRMTWTAGVILGLAIVTKPQYLTLLPLSIIAVAVIDTRTQGARSIRWYASLLAGVALTPILWAAALVMIIGPAHVPDQVSILRNTGNTTLMMFDAQHIMQTVWSVLGPAGFFLVLPSGVYGAWRARRARGDSKLVLTAMVTFQATWLIWFVFLSNGWVRYAFPSLVISAMFIGMMVSDLVVIARSNATLRSSAYAALTVVSILAVAGSTRGILPIFSDGSQDAKAFSVALNQRVPVAASVSGWEPEINFLADRPLIYPPVGSLSEAMRAHALHQDFDLTVPHPDSDFLVVGEFGRLVGIYQPLLDEGSYSLVLSVGKYELYQRID